LTGVVGSPPAFADSIAPATYSATLAVGGSATIKKTVTITQQATAPVDVFFLTDTTGSMGGAINNIRTGFSNLVSTLSGVASNIAFGAGEYKDVGDFFSGGGNIGPYRENSDLTTSTAAVQSAMGAWVASGGGDLPEANVFGLQQAATGTSWRSGSQRFLVWAGDAPGHDPSNGATLAGATAALVAADVTVYAASATSGPGINQTGQATSVAAATGGSFLGTFNPANFATVITNALTTGISTYSSVGLAVMGLPPGVSVNFVPAAITGSFDRSIERLFDFDVTFTGLAAGVYDFSIAALLDGRVVATESDHITVVGDKPPTTVPEPATLLLLGTGLAALGVRGRRRKQSVAI
jgi:hypothetical protein